MGDRLMNDAEITRLALKMRAQERGPYANDNTVMDALSQMWDGVDGPMAVLRKWGLDPNEEKRFWADFEGLLNNLKDTIPGVSISARKKGQGYEVL